VVQDNRWDGGFLNSLSQVAQESPISQQLSWPRTSLKEFCSCFKNGDHISHTINPLNCVEINKSNPLLVVTCAYSLAEMKDDRTLPFEIDPTTIEFHMIEAR
jgi:hypothetical protein